MKFTLMQTLFFLGLAGSVVEANHQGGGHCTATVHFRTTVKVVSIRPTTVYNTSTKTKCTATATKTSTRTSTITRSATATRTATVTKSTTINKTVTVTNTKHQPHPHTVTVTKHEPHPHTVTVTKSPHPHDIVTVTVTKAPHPHDIETVTVTKEPETKTVTEETTVTLTQTAATTTVTAEPEGSDDISAYLVMLELLHRAQACEEGGLLDKVAGDIPIVSDILLGEEPEKEEENIPEPTMTGDLGVWGTDVPESEEEEEAAPTSTVTVEEELPEMTPV